MTFEEFKNKYEKVPVKEYPNLVAKHPLVSVCVQTYQHAPYISECLDSILTQETDFPFEILLGEDASTDGTRKICMEYAEKYPDKIRLLLHYRANNIKLNDNPSGRFNFIYNLFSAKGEFIALCEGDDYWTDPFKLQKQVDYLKNNNEKGWVYHNHFCKINNSNEEFKLKNKKFKNYSFSEIIKYGGGFFHTGSLLFLNIFKNGVPMTLLKVSSGDMGLIVLLSLKKSGFLIDDYMSVYRIHDEGAFSKHINNHAHRIKLLKSKIKFLLGIRKIVDFKKKIFINKTILFFYYKIFKRIIKSIISN